MSRKVWLLIFCLVLLGLGIYLMLQKRGASQPKAYNTEALTLGDVSSRVTATGSLQAVTRISVGSEVSGRVIKLAVDYNSKVRKGQMLAQLDPSTFQAQVDQQRASLNDAQAAYESSLATQRNAGITVQRNEASILGASAQLESARALQSNNASAVLSAQANVQKSLAQLGNSQRFSERQKTLSQRDLIAKSDYDTARSTYLQDRSSLLALQNQAEGSQASLRSAQATVAARDADLGVARSTRDGGLALVTVAGAQTRSAAAKVRQARASLAQAQYNLNRTMLRSPIDGIVLDRKVTIGQTAAAQFQAPDLFTLAENLDQMQVEAAVDEADIGQVKQGAKATFTVDSFPEEKFAGTVSEVRKAPVTLQNVVTYTVIIRTSNPKLLLMPGMTATVAIQVATRRQALLTSNASLRFKAPAVAGESKPVGPVLYTLEQGKLKAHSVKLGITDGLHTELLQTDLKRTDSVVSEAASANTTSPTRSGGRLF